MIETHTICMNCGHELLFHCDEPWHFLRCCPGKCPGDTDKNELFHPPQPGIYTQEGYDVICLRPPDVGWAA